MYADSKIKEEISSGRLRVKNLPADWENNLQPNAYQPTIDSIVGMDGSMVEIKDDFFMLPRLKSYRVIHREQFSSQELIHGTVYGRSSTQRRGVHARDVTYFIQDKFQEIEMLVTPYFNTKIPVGGSIAQLILKTDASLFIPSVAVDENHAKVEPFSPYASAFALHASNEILMANNIDAWIELGKKYSQNESSRFFRKGSLNDTEECDFYLVLSKEKVELASDAAGILHGGAFSGGGMFGSSFLGIVDSGFKGRLTIGFHKFFTPLYDIPPEIKERLSITIIDAKKEDALIAYMTVFGVTGKVDRLYGLASNKYQNSEGIII